MDFDHGLTKAIGKISRRAGEIQPKIPRFIETVASRGYRFLADVAVVQGGQPQTAAGDPADGREARGLEQPPDADTPARSPAHAFGWKLSGVVTVLALAVLLSWFFLFRGGTPLSTDPFPWRCCRWSPS